MKKSLIVLILVFVTLSAAADEIVVTSSGQQVLLKDDGTWEYYNEPTPSQGAGKWNVSEKTDPLNDSKIITFLLECDSGRNSWGKPLYLVIRHTYFSPEKHDQDLFIVWGEYMGSDPVYVTTRTGQDNPSTGPWSISTDSKATFCLRPELYIPELLSADKFVVKATPYGENPVIAVFDVRGLKAAHEPYRELKLLESVLPKRF